MCFCTSLHIMYFIRVIPQIISILNCNRIINLCLKWRWNRLICVLKRVTVHVFTHCVTMCVFAVCLERQWAFVCLHPIFLLWTDTFIHTNTHSHTSSTHSSCWLPSSYNSLETAKQEQSDLLFLPQVSCPPLCKWCRQKNRWMRRKNKNSMGAMWWRVGGVLGQIWVTECVLITGAIQQGCDLRLWENSSGEQVLAAHTPNLRHFMWKVFLKFTQ